MKNDFTKLRSFSFPHWLLLIVYGSLILLRVPAIVWPGRFWAEEGTVYFSKYYSSSVWSSLLSVELGYYSLFNKLAIIPASRIAPLHLAPVFTMIAAFAVMITPAWLWLYSKPELRGNSYRMYAVLAVIMLAQPNQEIWLNTINSQFLLCVSTAIILISSVHRPLTHYTRLAILFIAGMTGAVSCMLLPFFWIEFAWDRDKRKFQEAIALTVACAVQVLCVVTSDGRDTGLHLNLLPWALLIKQWILPMFGVEIANYLAGIIRRQQLWQQTFLTMLALTPYVAISLGFLFYGSRRSWYLFASSLFIASISFLKSMEAQSADLIVAHISALGAGRYYYAPNVMMAIAIILPQRTTARICQSHAHIFRLATRWIVALYILVGIHDYVTSTQRHKWFFEGPSWQTEVQEWKKRESDGLKIWPIPWTMTIKQSEPLVEPSATTYGLPPAAEP